MSKDRHVTILGSGPAGLLVALAAKQKGYDARIISQGEPSVIPGATWLQKPIEGLTDNLPPTMITYAKVGTVDGYAQKAYGEPEAQVSWDSFVSGDRPGWSLRNAYAKLWSMFSNRIEKADLSIGDIETIAKEDGIVFSSIPLNSICKDEIAHDFEGQAVFFTDEPYIKIPNMIVYNGRDSDEWYRSSCLFGECQTEYAIHKDSPTISSRIKMSGSGSHRAGVKPVKNNCSCWSGFTNLIKVGRFGQWQRGVLVDHAYNDARRML